LAVLFFGHGLIHAAEQSTLLQWQGGLTSHTKEASELRSEFSTIARGV